MCLLRLELGVLTNGRLGTVELVSEYIKHKQAEEVCSVEINHVRIERLVSDVMKKFDYDK